MFSGKKLKTLRQRKDMSSTELAKLLGVSSVSISYWERGVYKPKDDYIQQMCKVFDVGESDFQETDFEDIISLNKRVPVITISSGLEEVSFHTMVPDSLNVDMGIVADGDMEPEIPRDSIVYVKKNCELVPGFFISL